MLLPTHRHALRLAFLPQCRAICKVICISTATSSDLCPRIMGGSSSHDPRTTFGDRSGSPLSTDGTYSLHAGGGNTSFGICGNSIGGTV